MSSFISKRKRSPQPPEPNSQLQGERVKRSRHSSGESGFSDEEDELLLVQQEPTPPLAGLLSDHSPPLDQSREESLVLLKKMNNQLDEITESLFWKDFLVSFSMVYDRGGGKNAGNLTDSN